VTGIVGALLVLALLVGVFALMLRGGPGFVGRPPKGIWTRQRDPTEGAYFAAPMAAYAVAAFAASFANAFTSSTAIAIGFIFAVLATVPGIREVAVMFCGWVAVLLAFYAAGRFIAGAGEFDELASLYRLGVMVVVLLAFCLGALLGDRDSAIAGSRGYALFGLVEIATFLAAPSGRDTVALGQLGNAAFLALIAVVGALVGWAVSPYMLGVIVIAVAVLSALQTHQDPSTAAGLWAAGTAAVALFLGRSLMAAFQRRS